MRQVSVKKADTPVEQRLVWGEVYAPNRPDVHGEYMSADDIKEMAYEFMRRKMDAPIDIQHDNKARPKITVVESFIARAGDPDFIEGAWVVCVHINDDEIWEKVKSGELNGFSVEALVFKETHEREVEMPDTITGDTSLVADHRHKFNVRYDMNGNLIGGTTDLVNGHVHRILGGTITEVAAGHRHRFSSVDGLQIV